MLNAALSETKAEQEKVEVKDAVVHWFKCDLRTRDNHALYLASEKAKKKGVPLIAMYIVSRQNFEAHLTATVRVDFILRNLEVLKADLAKFDIPLYVETVERGRLYRVGYWNYWKNGVQATCLRMSNMKWMNYGGRPRW